VTDDQTPRLEDHPPSGGKRARGLFGAIATIAGIVFGGFLILVPGGCALVALFSLPSARTSSDLTFILGFIGVMALLIFAGVSVIRYARR
jgi:hypothetical protein